MTDTFYHYWQVVQRKLPAILLISVAAAVVAWLVVLRLGPTYAVHYSYLVSLSEREEVEDFSFDGYYALSATDLFAATLASWVSAPEVVVAAYEEAGLTLPSHDPRDVVQAVAAEKKSPQLVAVTVRHKNQEDAEHLARGLQSVMEENVKRYNDQGIPALTFRVVATEPWTSVRQIEVAVVVIATSLFVFLAAINVVLLIESIRRLT
ncbi:MAG: hypothetical protein ABIH36_02435 [bacterium]